MYFDPSDPLGLKNPDALGTDRKSAQVVTTLVPPPLPAATPEVSNFGTGPIAVRYRVIRNTVYV